MKVAESFSRSLFWDVKPENLDWHEHKRFIIERILVRRGMKDVKKIFLPIHAKK